MLIGRPFPFWLCCALLGTYVVLFGTDVFFTHVRRSEPNYFSALPALLTAVALLVQMGAVIWAGVFLIRQARYRSWLNVALTVAGAVLPVVVIVRVMTFEGQGRFHM